MDSYEGLIKVVCKFTDLDTGVVQYKLQIKDSEFIAPLSDFNTGYLAVKLAKYDLIVTQDDASELVSYLKSQIVNEDYPKISITTRMGYVKDRYVHPLDKEIVVKAVDPGEAQYIENIKSKGTMEEWRDNLIPIYRDNPSAMLLIVASFASVMVEHFKLDPFIVEVFGLTSTGKSTIIKIAGSAWGGEKFVNQWNTTYVAAEQYAAYSGILPVVFDDTKKASKSNVEKIIYLFSDGRSRARGNGTGTQLVRSWRNILLSTGEYSILNFAKGAGGAAARCISVGLQSQEISRKTYDKIYKTIRENYGVPGYLFFDYWRNVIKDENNSMEKRLEAIMDRLADKVENQVLIRLARSYSVIILAAEILNEQFDFNLNIEIFYKLFNDLREENEDVDLPLTSLEALLDTVDRERAFGGKYYLSEGEENLLVPVQYLKQFLGENNLVLRKIWLNRGYIVGYKYKNTNKLVDYKKNHTVDISTGKGHKRNTIAIPKKVYNELGYDFEVL